MLAFGATKEHHWAMGISSMDNGLWRTAKDDSTKWGFTLRREPCALYRSLSANRRA